MIESLANGLSGALAPDFLLRIGKRDITRNISPRLISLTLTDNRGYAADNLNLTLNDADGMLELPERGEVLQLFLGWKGFALIDKGTFTVDQITHSGAPDVVKITANSADFRGSINQPQEGAWHETTVGKITEAIASRNALEASVNPVLSSLPVAHIDQSQETDISFITRLARLYGGEVTIKSGKLLMLKAGSALVASGQCLRPVVIQRSEGDTHTFTIADRDACTGVIAKWTDTATPKKQEKHVLVQRKTTGSQSYMSGKKDNISPLKQTFSSKETAVYAAKAEWECLQREAASFSLALARGREALCPDTPVKVAGFKTLIDDHDWIITKLTHTLSKQGFTTKLDLELAINDVEYDITEK